MIHHEVTFIVDPVLSGDEIKATAQTYVDYLQSKGGTIVHMDEMGLRNLAYPIKKRSSGVYFCIEFSMPDGKNLADFELQMRRDERLLRFLTVRLDKYGIKFNEDKRNGLIGKKKKSESRRPSYEELAAEASRNNPAPVVAAQAPAPPPPVVAAPVVEAPVVEEEE